MSIDWASELHAHEQIARELRRRIAAGIYARGQQLSRVELEAEFDVSHVTVSKATTLLKEEELVMYRPGRGILVTGKPPAGTST